MTSDTQMPGYLPLGRPGSWVELSVVAAVEAADAIAEVFRANDVHGVAVEALLTPGADEGVADRQDRVRIVAYLPIDDDTVEREQRIRRGLWHLAAFDLAPMTEPARKILVEEDWANAWKQHFHPVRIGRRFVIKPSWHQFEPLPGDLIIELDPGMAFGTGLHPTTRMMLEAVENAMGGGDTRGPQGRVFPGSDVQGPTVFDVGTGSGILAIGSVLLGARRVTAVDVETVACRVARENADLNGVVDRITVLRGSIEQGMGKYEFILANIVSRVLIDIAPAFPGLMHANTRAFISGVIEEHAHAVNEAFSKVGVTVVNTMKTGDWRCYELRLAT